MSLKEELDERIVVVVAARCQECDFEAPKVHPRDYPDLKIAIDAEWERTGIGAHIQWAWPRRWPAWLVRQGFLCPFCGAPNMLLALEADA